MPDDPCLDQHPALAAMGPQSQRGITTATMSAGAPTTTAANADASRFIRERPDLGDERLGFGCTATALPDRSGSDLNFIVAHNIAGDRSSDGAENGKILPFRGRRASRGDGWLALESLIFCPSTPQPTARLLSCHRKLPFHSSELNLLRPSPIHDRVRHRGKCEFIANGLLKQVRKGRQAGAVTREAELARPR